MIRLIERKCIFLPTNELIIGYYWESEEVSKGVQEYTEGLIYKDGYSMLLSKDEYYKHAKRKWDQSRRWWWASENYINHSLCHPTYGHMRKHYLMMKYH